ncbi:MAG TPA: glucose-6-phosphate isomerase [Gemmataceae bacterium]|jgi:glucose-6-phosphate isomerase|nr:glucose-6-phosphate isomerase [Gemmataceae bacterium]
MQLPDEAIEFNYAGALLPHADAWSPLAELQAKHLLRPERLEAVKQQMMQVRQQVASERSMSNPPTKLLPLDSGFIDLPTKYLETYRKRGEVSEVGRILAAAKKLKEEVDRVVVLGIGGSYLGARALFDALCPTLHNEMPDRMRMGRPRLYFEGNNVDNDALQELMDLFENTCVDPNLKEERWGAVVISKSGGTIETAAAYRVIRNELTRYYGHGPEAILSHVAPITGPNGKLRELCIKDGFKEPDILTIPDGVGGRFSVFTAVGLLPAAVVGLDVLALLLGASTMTQRFLSEPFERNPVLQYAAVNHLMATEHGKDTRIMAVWSKKLEALGWWYDQLLSESLGKQGIGPTPITSVYTRDLHSRGQQHQEGTRDKLINNVVVKGTRQAPIQIGMADRNEDDLNKFSRRTLPEVLRAAHQGTSQAYAEAARPTTDLTLPALSEHVLGQVMQMLMLATVVEGRLLGVNPYGQPGVEAYKNNMTRILKESSKSTP